MALIFEGRRSVFGSIPTGGWASGSSASGIAAAMVSAAQCPRIRKEAMNDRPYRHLIDFIRNKDADSLTEAIDSAGIIFFFLF